MKRFVGAPAAVALVLACLFAATGARADTPPAEDADVIRQMFLDGGVDESWIAPIARGQLTPAVVAAALARVLGEAGPLVGVAADGDNWLVSFDNGTATVFLARDDDGLISGLFVSALVPADTSLDQPAAALAELPGDTALLVVAGGQVLAEHNPDAELLVASAFKLAVLNALRQAIDDGRMSWDQVVRYDAHDASVAAGMLNGFPDGHPVTVATLAALMISVSDNTATDVLIDLVGRRAVEAAGGPAPLMTTAEYFKLKADQSLGESYLDSGGFGQRLILSGLAERPLPTVGDYANGRTGHGWRLSVRALCDLMAAVQDLDVMTINPGGAEGEAWSRIAFKGGNDIGVTNLTYMLTQHDGPPVCLSMTWNYADHYDDSGFSLIAARFLNVLASGG